MSLISPRIIEWCFFGVKAFFAAVGANLPKFDGYAGVCNANFDPDELFNDEPAGSLGYNLRRIFDYLEKC